MKSLGHTFRRLGAIVGIEHTRDEDEVRDDHHGGSVSGLNQRQVAHAKKMDNLVSKRETKL
jgi:hypothetical protein